SRVLWIDQGPIVEVIEQMLIPNGYQVRSIDRYTKYEPKAAIEIARAFQPHVAVLELLMPVMDGTLLGMELSNVLPRTKIVLRTALTDVECKDISDTLAKRGYRFELFNAPFEKEELLKQMKAWVFETIIIDFVTGFYLPEQFKFI